MLDKLSRKILKYMRENPDVGEVNYNRGIFAIADGILEEPRQVRAAVGFLESNGFINRIRGGENRVIGFRLSHIGLHSDEFEHLKASEKRKAWIMGVISTVITELVIAGIMYGISLLTTALSQNG